jgi:hypothetical protein
MSDPAPDNSETRRTRDWNGFAAIVATLVGLLALVVSGYTAHVQRQQVRAEVWPFLLIGNDDPRQAIEVLNKGVGPALVHGVQVWIDGRPQRSWDEALKTLGIPPHGYQNSTLTQTVLSPGEQMTWIRIADPATYLRFRDAYRTRIGVEACFCSTLDDCWVYSRRMPGGGPTQHDVAQCPAPSAGGSFTD